MGDVNQSMITFLKCGFTVRDGRERGPKLDRLSFLKTFLLLIQEAFSFLTDWETEFPGLKPGNWPKKDVKLTTKNNEYIFCGKVRPWLHLFWEKLLNVLNNLHILNT